MNESDLAQILLLLADKRMVFRLAGNDVFLLKLFFIVGIQDLSSKHTSFLTHKLPKFE